VLYIIGILRLVFSPTSAQFKSDINGAFLCKRHQTSHRIIPNTPNMQPTAAFTVIDPWEVKVGTYATEDAAKQDIERCKKEDAMYETAKQLVDAAMTAHAEMFGISRETASYWIRSAAETVD
jgi:hypothetical protein